jgi:signal transduction histidine kinase
VVFGKHSRFRGNALRGVLVVSLVVCISRSVEAAAAKRVLTLQSFGRGFEPHGTFTGLFQTELAKSLPEPPELYDVSLASALDTVGESESAAVAYLDALDAERAFDLVIAIGAPAARFVQRHRGRLFPGTPLLIAGTDRAHVVGSSLSAEDATVLVAIDPGAILENILAVLPDTNRIEVVIGTSPIERFWREEIEIAATEIADRAEVAFLDGLPFDRVVERAASPPPRAAFLYAFLVSDAAGVPHRDDTALQSLHAASRAPIFGVFDHQIGKGIVGGPLVPLRVASRETAEVAVRLLDGEAPANLRPPPIGLDPPVYDARELARFGVDERRLPPGSTVVFGSPGLWKAYRWQIAAVSVLVVGQAFLITALLVNRVRRRRAETEVLDLSGRLVAAQEEEWRRLARELHDDVSQRLARLAIDVARVDRTTGGRATAEALRGIEEGLASVSEDIHGLSYRLHPSVLEDLGLADALEVECERFSDRASLPADLAVRNLPAEISEDAALCLFRILQEALRNVERHARARRVDVELEGRDGGLAITVRDDGVGIDGERARARMGIGLASMRERVHVLAGTFEVDSAPDRGTTIRAFVPVAGTRP